MPYDDLIEKHARRVGIDPALMKTIMRIESSGKASEQTGSYKGLFQLSDREFSRHGGSGSIFDPEQNTMAAANKLARESLAFREKYGREPKPIDVYMMHQQGEAGYGKHLENPDQPAWKNMLATGEGQQKGEAWAKKAIWGNLPKSEKDRLGSVENVTSRDFVNSWGQRIEGGGPEYLDAGTKPSEEKMAAMTGKGPERKPTFMGMDFEVPQPRIDLQIPQFTPRFQTA